MPTYLTFLWYLNYKVWANERGFPLMPYAVWLTKPITDQLLWATYERRHSTDAQRYAASHVASLGAV